MRNLLTLAVLILGSITANAKTVFYSSFSNTTPPTECVQEIHVVNPLITRFHGPADWTWVVACDESAWKTIELKSGFNKATNGQIMGLTDLGRRTTWVRGWVILHPIDITADAQPRHAVSDLKPDLDRDDIRRRGMTRNHQSNTLRLPQKLPLLHPGECVFGIRTHVLFLANAVHGVPEIVDGFGVTFFPSVDQCNIGFDPAVRRENSLGKGRLAGCLRSRWSINGSVRRPYPDHSSALQ
jgi:hypothetical protein